MIYIIKAQNYNRNRIMCCVKAHFTLGKKIKDKNMGGGVSIKDHETIYTPLLNYNFVFRYFDALRKDSLNMPNL